MINYTTSKDFIRTQIDFDLKNKKHSHIITRFPPEPNGYLHIGHAKSICLNFGISKEYPNSSCNLRFDDTNPEKEETHFVDAIKKDLKWLNVKWKNLHFSSNYFDKLYLSAIKLIKMGKAFICDLSIDEIRDFRGTLSEPGSDSPYRNRSIEENLSLFGKMKKGDFKDGFCCLRAKIDMTSGNINMRDPVLYRIRKVNHPNCSIPWNIYPTYDYTHCISDAIEKITHSLCTLEFEDHRPLYNWILETLEFEKPLPQQIEFARLNMTYCLMSKRKLSQLVDQKFVENWSDPRMPTLSGLCRRGYTASSIHTFCQKIGLAKRNSIVDIQLLESCIRQELNQVANRMMAVLDPVKVIIQNYLKDKTEKLEARNNPENLESGTRFLTFSKEIYIDRSDFLEDAPKKFFRLSPGHEVRLRYGYLIKCESFKKDSDGNIIEIYCSYDPKSKGGKSSDGRRVKGIIHWVDAQEHNTTSVYLYDHLFNVKNPGSFKDLGSIINSSSLIVKQAKIEKHLSQMKQGERVQFERIGYFYVDRIENEQPVFHRIVNLKDTWSKLQKK